MQAPDPVLDRHALERLERLALKWSRSFEGLLGGANRSRYPGAGHEFLDHRPFQQGDDLRQVNWRAYMRLERLFLRMFRTEPRTPVALLLDTSESMTTGGVESGEPKFHFACRLAASLCYIGLVRLETIRIVPFASGLGEEYRAQGGRHRFAKAAAFLSSLETAGESDFGFAVRRYCERTGAPGLVIVLSDFLDESDCPAALERLAGEGHEIQLVHLGAPEDRTPPWEGELELADAETGQVRRVQADGETARLHAEAYDEYGALLERAARRHEGRYVHLMTDASLEESVFGTMLGTGAVSLQ